MEELQIGIQGQIILSNLSFLYNTNIIISIKCVQREEEKSDLCCMKLHTNTHV